MKNLIFVYCNENKTFKNYIRGKKKCINISYIDLQENQEKFLVLENEKFSLSVLECELYEKLYTSIRKLKNSDLIENINYFLDTDNKKIITELITNIKKYNSKIGFSDLQFNIIFLDNLEHSEWLEKIVKQEN